VKVGNCMPGSALARTMLASAQRDLKTLSNMMDSELFDDEVFGFHTQQATEKALKAWLILVSGSRPYTHDLGLVLNDLERAGADVHDYWNLVDLNSYAVRFRYEAAPVDDDPLDRLALLNDARALVARVASMIEDPPAAGSLPDDSLLM